MALKWIEGFETFGTTIGSGGAADALAGMKRKYGGSMTALQLAAGRSGGYSMSSNTTTTQDFEVSLGSAPTDDTWIVGAAMKFPSFPDDDPIITIGAGSGCFSLQTSSTGQIGLTQGEIYAVFAETTDPVLTTNTWHYIELKVRIHDTAGSYEVRVDGVTVLSASDTDTKFTTSPDLSIVQFCFRTNGQEFDDIYICDTDGTKNNDLLGRVKVEGVFPDADGDSSDWTPSSGTDHSVLVSDNPADDDTSYVESNTQDDVDLFAYDDLSAITTESILGVQINTDVRMNEFPGNLDIMLPVKSSTTTSDGDVTNVNDDDYTIVHRILENDPATSTAWTASGINSAQFGIKVGT